MFEVTDIQPKIGSEVRIDRDAFLAGTYAKQIEQLVGNELPAFTKCNGQVFYPPKAFVKIGGFAGQ